MSTKCRGCGTPFECAFNDAIDRKAVFIAFAGALAELKTRGCVKCNGHEFDEPLYTEEIT